MPKIVVTGVGGFVGKHLARELKARGCVVIGVGREEKLNPLIANLTDKYFACDLTNRDEVSKLPLDDIDGVINLAGFANVGASFGQEELYKKANVGVLTVLGEEMIRQKIPARMLAVSTGAVYSSDQQLPLDEGSKLISHGSPYALSKIAMEEEATRLIAKGLNCIIARPFNHIGPGQEPGFLVPDLYEKVSQVIADGGFVKVGNLSTKRDYTDVRDVARAYADLILSDSLDHRIYNICSGKSIEGSAIFELLVKYVGGSEKVRTEIDPQFIRANDPKDLYGDNSRLCSQTNWKPKIPIEQTIKDFVANKRA